MNEANVYTFGAYEEVFAQGKTAVKMGPKPAGALPREFFPPSFFENDGSYGGGEAFDSIEKASEALREQLKSGKLPQNQRWYIYLLDANFQNDTKELHTNDFRLQRDVKVIRRVSEEIQLSTSPRPK